MNGWETQGRGIPAWSPALSPGGAGAHGELEDRPVWGCLHEEPELPGKKSPGLDTQCSGEDDGSEFGV